MKDRDGKPIKVKDEVNLHCKGFTYKSSTVSYLDEERDIVGIFTPYGPCEFKSFEVSLK